VQEPDFRLTIVNAALSDYIRVHNDIFAFSLRKLIPIPGLFRKIDYAAHAVALASISSDLERVNNGLTDQSQPPSFKPYVVALHATVDSLLRISLRMVERVGRASAYPWAQYRSDQAAYQILVADYYALGAKLNAELRSATASR
jgi:hypothetical protein